MLPLLVVGLIAVVILSSRQQATDSAEWLLAIDIHDVVGIYHRDRQTESDYAAMAVAVLTGASRCRSRTNLDGALVGSHLVLHSA